MTHAVTFTVPGDPVAKGRPKFARRGKFVTTYTPEKTARYENLVKLAAQQAMRGREPIAGPIEVTMCVFMAVPESWSKKKRAAALAGTVLPTKKPDLSNIEKAVEDGMNAVVYADDSAIVDTVLRKRYAETPRVDVLVARVQGEPA